MLAENPAEVAGIGEADGMGGLLGAEVAVDQQVAGSADAFGDQVLLDGTAGMLLEQAAQVAVAVAEVFLEIPHGDAVGQMVAHVFLHPGDQLGIARRLSDLAGKSRVLFLELRAEEIGK